MSHAFNTFVNEPAAAGGGGAANSVREIRFILDTTATQDSTAVLPANSRVIFASIEITTAYDGGTSIQVGTTATADLFQAAGDNNPQSAANRIYEASQDTDAGAASVVRVAVSNTPAAGAGVCVVRYTAPSA